MDAPRAWRPRASTWPRSSDLTDESQARTLVDAALERFGRIDVLVNNAGLAQSGDDEEGSRPVSELDALAFERDLALNLWTAFHATRAVLPSMLERGYGRIVMVSSVTGPVVVNPEGAGYATAKAGMDGLMRSIARPKARAT
jgi:3-oxoacyl-[acyl-carrier protein] reductase